MCVCVHKRGSGTDYKRTKKPHVTLTQRQLLLQWGCRRTTLSSLPFPSSSLSFPTPFPEDTACATPLLFKKKHTHTSNPRPLAALRSSCQKHHLPPPCARLRAHVIETPRQLLLQWALGFATSKTKNKQTKTTHKKISIILLNNANNTPATTKKALSGTISSHTVQIACIFFFFFSFFLFGNKSEVALPSRSATSTFIILLSPYASHSHSFLIAHPPPPLVSLSRSFTTNRICQPCPPPPTPNNDFAPPPP